MMLSDHGFCGTAWEVNLNVWLQQEGLLRFQTGAPRSLEEIDGRSLAYSLIPGRFYINLKGREPRGTVEPGAEYERVRQRIADGLLKLRDPQSGEQVIDRIEMRETIYGDDASAVAPDMVALSRPGYELKDRIGERELFKPATLKGMHTFDDAFLFVNKKQPIPEDIEIYKATEILARHCRCRSPKS
jgi:predicted AlkP superfamily phosphohydrolase/phosphomutase